MKIGNVSFINSFPFQYGLDFYSDFVVSKMVPSAIARALENDSIDVGLVPVAIFLQHPEWKIVSDYCIGALGSVKTVLLLSKKPIDAVETISFDPDSRSSNMLTQLLCASYWKINPIKSDREHADACVMIGDKAFLDYSATFPYCYDLAQEWFKFQKMPFVFAVWVSNKQISEIDEQRINEIMKFGVNHLEESVNYFSESLSISPTEALFYLKNHISFLLDTDKKIAINRFAELATSVALI